MIRHDYAHPFRIDAGSSQAARAAYATHVNQLIRQLLLTNPGERVCRPEFGSGLRRMVFANQSPVLAATARIQIQQAIDDWLSDQVALRDVTVLSGSDSANGLDQGEILITISYTLIETQDPAQLDLKVV